MERYQRNSDLQQCMETMKSQLQEAQAREQRVAEANQVAQQNMVNEYQKAVAASRQEAATEMKVMQTAIEEQEIDARTKEVHRKLREEAEDKAALRQELDQALSRLQAKELGGPVPVVAPGADPPLPPRDHHQPVIQSPPRQQVAPGATNPATFNIATDDEEKISLHSPFKTQSEQSLEHEAGGEQ